MNILQVSAIFVLAVGGSVRAAPVCPPLGDADANPAFDATLLKEGRFTYRTSMDGKPLGDTVIELRRVGSDYRLTMSAAEIGQSWEATVKPSFAPVAAHLVMRSKSGPYEMNLRYGGSRISGEERHAGVVTPVRSESSGVVIDQRVDWASMMAVEAPIGRSVTMRVFDPSSAFSPLLGTVGLAPTMRGAWGEAAAVRFDYSICKRDHVENYTVFATRETPRYMLREDMPNGLVSELVRIEP